MKAIYKCRLCGAIYHNGTIATKEVAERCIFELNVGLVCTQPMAPRMTETHNCGGQFAGSLGLADFQGWQEEEAEQ